MTNTLDVVGFGTLSATISLMVEKWPEPNGAALYHDRREVVSHDAAMIACLLRGWEIRSGLIGTAVGDDYRGKWIANHLKSRGVISEVRLDPNLDTMFTLLASDPTGARTAFWENRQEILDTLDTADLSLLDDSRILYVDWYDEDRIIRPMDAAASLGVPVFLNLEHLHQDPDLLTRYAGRSTICQAVTDELQRGEEQPITVAKKLLDSGVEIAIVTLAGEGCLVIRQTEAIRVWAPAISPIDSFGAGAVFSAGFIYGYLQGWNLENMARFATAAASLKVAKVGLETPDLDEVKELAAQLKVKNLEYV